MSSNFTIISRPIDDHVTQDIDNWNSAEEEIYMEEDNDINYHEMNIDLD